MGARANRFPLFDALRAIAALSVLFFHTRVAEPIGALAPYFAHLDVGVTLFFIISGFLLWRPWAAAHIVGGAVPSTSAYARRRFARIVPAYWVALAVFGVLFSTPGVLELPSGLVYAGFAQIYSPRTAFGGIGQAWTLCVEVVFYVFVPVWGALTLRLGGDAPAARARRQLLALGLLALVAVAWNVWALAGHVPVDPGRVPVLLAFPAWLDAFAAGMALAALSAVIEVGGAARVRDVLVRRAGLCWLVALVAFVAVAQLEPLTVAWTSVGSSLARHDLYVLIALALAAPAAVAAPTVGVRRVLALKPLLWIGLVSYGIYLYHGAVIAELVVLMGGLPSTALEWAEWLALSTGGAVLAGALSYYAVERPARALARGRRRAGVDPDQPGAVSVPVAP